MREELKRRTSKRKATLEIQIFKGQTIISEAARQYDLTPSEIQSWINDALIDLSYQRPDVALFILGWNHN